MIAIYTIAGVLFTIFALILAIRVWQRERRWLFAVIPAALTLALTTWFGLNDVLGYPTGMLDRLQEKFRYVHHVEIGKTVYLTVLHKDEREPRIYAIDDPTQEQKKALRGAQKRAQKGIGQMGEAKKQRGGISRNDFVFYDFKPNELGRKTAGQ